MHSFQNMYDTMGSKMDSLAGKLDFLQKIPLKSPFLGDKKRDPLSLGGAGGLNVNKKLTSGVPLKSLGHKGRELDMWNLSGIKIEVAAGRRIFSPTRNRKL